MAQLTLTIPDAQVPRVRAALADQLGKAPADVTIADVKGIIINQLKSIVRAYEIEQDMQAARNAVTEIDDMS